MPRNIQRDSDFRDGDWRFKSPYFPTYSIKDESLEELSLLQEPNPIDEIKKYLDPYDFENDIRTWIK